MPEPEIKPMTDTPVRLTSLAHGGGCGCKLISRAGFCAEILAGMPLADARFPICWSELETSDDAAVWRLNEAQALVATTDFFMPIVDDPFDFGRIAATNALSDVYAMGGKPILALAIVGMPVARMSADQIRGILAGGASVCAAAGIPIAGGPLHRQRQSRSPWPGGARPRRPRTGYARTAARGRATW